MDLSGYNKNNQIEILELSLKKSTNVGTIDILPVMDQIILYEDFISQLPISARLIFRDQVNLVGSLPIVGGETITVKFRTPVYTDVTTLEFVVYAIGDRGMPNSTENIQINELKLCTPEVWKAANTEVSSYYHGTYTDIISKILAEVQTTKKIDKEESMGIVDFAGPGFNTFQAIRFCTSRSNTKTASPMFFWETTKGYRIKSLKEVYRGPQNKFLYIEDRAVAGVDKDADKVFNTCYSFDYLESNNRLQQYQDSAFGSDNYSVDFTNARIIKNRTSYKDVFHAQDIKLNKFELPDPMENFRSKEDYIPYRSDLSHRDAFNRRSTLSTMDNLKLMVSIPGDSQLQAGDIVWLEIPARVGLSVGSEPLSSGKWLVRSMKHLITKRTYSQICELTKDSFDADPAKVGA